MLTRKLPHLVAVVTLAIGCNKPDTAGNAQPSASAAPEAAGCKGDADCKGGTLCESGACVPAAVAEKVRGTAAAVASAAGTSTLPAIPTTKSSPPKVAEWEAAADLPVVDPSTQADKCTLKVVREWLRVTCNEDYSGYEEVTNFGAKDADYFEFVQAGKVVSFVVRLKAGDAQSVRICGTDKRAALFVNWPTGKDRPIHIGVTKGPACDGTFPPAPSAGASAAPGAPSAAPAPQAP